MYLHQLQLINFKNHSGSVLSCGPGINFLLGHNGAGKTNVLDAIYLLCYGKSYLNPSDAELIKYESEFYRLESYWQDDNAKEVKLTAALQKGKRKQLQWNDNPYKRLSDHIGKIPLIIISPNDANLMNGGSEERRKLLDSMLVQVSPDYLSALLQYDEVLTQRNALLKNAQGNQPDSSVLAYYNEALVKHGSLLFHCRKAGLAALEKDFMPIYQALSAKDEHIDMVYHSDLLENDYLELLESSLRKDLILEYTSKGPHRDDIKLVIDNNPAKKFASQGQQKSMLIALKLAQYRYLHQEKQQKPILLIDDIFDKLDLDRCKNLINLLNNDNFGQIFITDTDIARMKLIFKDDLREKHFFEVSNGEVVELAEGK